MSVTNIKLWVLLLPLDGSLESIHLSTLSHPICAMGTLTLAWIPAGEPIGYLCSCGLAHSAQKQQAFRSISTLWLFSGGLHHLLWQQWETWLGK